MMNFWRLGVFFRLMQISVVFYVLFGLISAEMWFY